MADPLEFGDSKGWQGMYNLPQYGANDPGVPNVLPQGLHRTAGGTYYGAGTPTPDSGSSTGTLNWGNVYAQASNNQPAEEKPPPPNIPPASALPGSRRGGGGGGGGGGFQLTGLSPQAYAAAPYAPPAQERDLYNQMKAMLMDPSSAANHPAYKFLQQEQERALARSAAGRRMRYHGDTLDAFARRAADRAHLYTGEYTGRLASGADRELQRSQEERSRYDVDYANKLSALNRLTDMATFASIPGASGANVDYIRNLNRLEGPTGDMYRAAAGVTPMSARERQDMEYQDRMVQAWGPVRARDMAIRSGRAPKPYGYGWDRPYPFGM